MKAYSLDLRERVIAAAESGEFTRQKVAEVFSVSLTWVKRLVRRKRELGHVEPLPHGGGQKPLLDDARLERLRREVVRHTDVTLEELCERVRGVKGNPVSVPTMSRTLAKLGFTRKKEGALSRRTEPSRARRALGVDGSTPARGAPAHLH